jgi:two-component sensor histidine kinase
MEVIPKATAAITYEVEHDFPALGRRTMLLTARTLHHPDNGGHSMLLSIVDATDRSRRDAAQDMLFGELRHRMKNLLAVAQSIARQTTTKGRSAEEENSRLRLNWVESGGPPVTPPATTGYGTQLIQSATTYSLGGQVEQKHAAGGLDTEIVIPLGRGPAWAD